MTDESWRQAAACRGMDPAVFHPFAHDPPAVKQAKAVCATCPVTAECLDYAMRNFEKIGIWGGLSENERRPLRGQKNAYERRLALREKRAANA